MKSQINNVINLINYQEKKQSKETASCLNNKEDDLSTQASNYSDKNNSEAQGQGHGQGKAQANKVPVFQNKNNVFGVAFPLDKDKDKKAKNVINIPAPENKSKPIIQPSKSDKTDKDKKVDNIREFIKNQKHHNKPNENDVIYLPGRNVYDKEIQGNKEKERHSLHSEPQKNQPFAKSNESSGSQSYFHPPKQTSDLRNEKKHKNDFDIEIYTPESRGKNINKGLKPLNEPKDQDSFEEDYEDNDFIDRTKKAISNEKENEVKDNFIAGFTEEDFILEDEEISLQKSIKEDLFQINLLKTQLESLFGKQVYLDVYKIVKQNTQTQTFSYDILTLTKAIYGELVGKYNKDLLNDVSNKIPEFYSIVFSEGKLK